MAVLVDLLLGVFRRHPTLAGAALELAVLAAPLWATALVELVIGWASRPRWAGAIVGDHPQQQQAAALPPPQPMPTPAVVPRQPETVEGEQLAVNNGDLMHLWRLVQEKDAGPSWIHMMDRTLPDFRYQAWQRDPPKKNCTASPVSPPRHCSH